MYCAPLGLAYANRPDELFQLAPALSALTHFDGRCRTAVLAVTLAVAALVRGRPRNGGSGCARGGADQRAARSSSSSSRPRARLGRSTDPIRVLSVHRRSRVQALVRGGDAETELRRVVSLGGDTDTNAAVAGALLGARDE